MQLPVSRGTTVSARDIRRVLADPFQPHLVFQPIVDLKRGVIAGYETLARFTGPPDATPDVWFAVADRCGFGAALEARVISAALIARHSMPPGTFLAINVSPHLLPTPEVRDAFASGGTLRGVVVELTEHSPIADSAALATALEALRRRHAQIAIDDAGSGYAGLQQIVEVRPGLLKVDRALVDRVDENPIKRALTELLGSLAGQIDCWLLAEGIERDEELATAIDLAVPLGQGWLLGRPTPDWQQLSPDLATRIRLLAHRETHNNRISSLAARSTQHEIRAALSPTGSATPGPDDSVWRVELDANDLPLHLHHGATRRPITLRVSPTADIDPVILRALARPEEHRYEPLVVVDAGGHYVGLALMERLIAHLASSSHTSDLPVTAPKIAAQRAPRSRTAAKETR